MGLRDSWVQQRKSAAAAVQSGAPTTFNWYRQKTRVGRLIAFLEGLPITKGIRVGESMKLLPVQRDFIKDVYGAGEDNEVRLGVLSAPRGQGKTGLIAGLALAHLLGPECEARGEVYSAAIDRQQAALIFAEMVAIIMAVPEFASRVNVQRFHKKIEVMEGLGAGSVYEALSADARRAHGLAPSFWCYDELAQAKDRQLLDNLQTAMGKRERSLGIIISTQAPTDDHPLSQMIDDGLSGLDPGIKVRLLSAPEDADPFDPRVLRSVNPAFGKFLKEADVLAELTRAKRVPSFLPAFRNLRLNQRIDSSAEHRVLTRDVWDLGNIPVDIDGLEGAQCYAGLDLSAKHDLTALVMAFPDREPEDDPIYDIVLYAWTPADSLAARTPTEQGIFKRWIDAGLLIAVPGPVVRYSFVAQELAKLAQRYHFASIAYDRWRIDDLKQELDAIGVQEGDLPLVPFGQGFQSMAPAVEWFTELAKSGRLRHGGNPVLAAAVANTITTMDASGNVKFDKSKSRHAGSVRIDPAVATVMALGAAKRAEPVLDVRSMIV